MSEEKLINGLRKGDRSAQEDVYCLYKNIIASTISKYITRDQDIEELLQDVFVKIFRKIDQFKEKSKLSTWIVKIAINTALNFVENTKKRNEIINTIDTNENYEWSSNFCNPEELLINKEGNNILIKVAALLPDNQKTAFLLFYTEGLSQLEISDIMGKSIDAVESLIQRSRVKFKSLFQINSIN